MGRVVNEHENGRPPLGPFIRPVLALGVGAEAVIKSARASLRLLGNTKHSQKKNPPLVAASGLPI